MEEVDAWLFLILGNTAHLQLISIMFQLFRKTRRMRIYNSKTPFQTKKTTTKWRKAKKAIWKWKVVNCFLKDYSLVGLW
jgi:hypothetical protein